MTFEEFFKKKKINLTTFSEAEGSLFAEFKTHYEAMGEKSFDHTKKYWFNKLRRLYPTPPEVKAEKLIIENQLAEQTITETLTAPTAASAPLKAGFSPRFKAGAIKPKPAQSAQIIEEKSNIETTLPPATSSTKPEDISAGTEPQNMTSVPKVGFKPRFKPPQK